jgi:hypothetical protein
MSTALLDDLIRSALNGPLEADGAPAWEAVLERAHTCPERRRIGLRRLVVAVSLAVLVLVPPAVAFHRQLLDLIEGKPAPTSVVNDFRSWNALRASAAERAIGMRLFAGRNSQVDAARARGVAELHTTAGPVSIWEAPQRHGGECWLFVFGAPAQADRTVTGSCDPALAAGPILTVEWIETHLLPGLRIVHVRARGVAAVELRLADGTTRTMDLVAGHALAALPRDVVPVAVVAKNSAGRVIETQPIRLPRAFPGGCPSVCTSSEGSGSHFIQFPHR